MKLPGAATSWFRKFGKLFELLLISISRSYDKGVCMNYLYASNLDLGSQYVDEPTFRPTFDRPTASASPASARCQHMNAESYLVYPITEAVHDVLLGS